MASYRLEPDDVAGFDHLVPDFIAVTADIDDPRLEARTRHALTTILFVCLSASMAGAKSVHAFGEFAEDAWAWVRKSLGPEIGTEPVSHDTIGRLLQKLRPDILERLLAAVAARELARREAADPVLAGEHAHQISIDGKRQLGTARKRLMNLAAADGGQQPSTTVSAYGVDSGLVLGCHTSTAPGAEHACVAAVLAMIDLRGACVSMDAGNAYPKFCRSIREGGGDYLLCVKGNNARTRELCRQVFDARVDRAYDTDETVVAARGDRRAARVAHLAPEREAGHGTGACDGELAGHWPGLRTVIEVRRRRSSREGKTDGAGAPKVSEHVVYYVSSRALTAREASEQVRAHWHVENRLHWTMDVSYGEDASRAKTGYLAQNLAAVKRMANNILAAVTGQPSRRRYQMKFAVDEEWRDQVWGLV